MIVGFSSLHLSERYGKGIVRKKKFVSVWSCLNGHFTGKPVSTVSTWIAF